MGYSFLLTARVLLYAPSHRQDSTYHSLCYTSRGALAGTRYRSMGPPHEGSILLKVTHLSEEWCGVCDSGHAHDPPTLLLLRELAIDGRHLRHASTKHHNMMEGRVLFNDALNTFYLRLYGVGHMVKDHSDSEKGNLLLPHGLLFPISSKGSFISTIPQTG